MLCFRLLVVARLPGIKKVMTLQTLMRLVGKDAPKDVKAKLEVSLRILVLICSDLKLRLFHVGCFVSQRKALSMMDQFSVPNAQYMISTMATMGFYSKPLIEVCIRKITGKTLKQLKGNLANVRTDTPLTFTVFSLRPRQKISITSLLADYTPCCSHVRLFTTKTWICSLKFQTTCRPRLTYGPTDRCRDRNLSHLFVAFWL